MKIEITGASGFVGENIQKFLSINNEIIPLSVRYVEGQKFELNSNAIIHLAGKAHDLKKVSNPDDYYKSNFELTKQLFDAFILSDVSVFIFMSTVKASADEVSSKLTEESIPNPKTHYGIAKFKAEEYIQSIPLPENKKVFILRPCMIHGPGNKGNLNLLYKIVSKKIPWPLGSFENSRSFLSIGNLIFVINELLENKKIPSGIYNVCDDQSLSTNQLVTIISSELNIKPVIWRIPKFVVKFIAKSGDILRLPLDSERLQKLTESYEVSNDKIKQFLGKEMPITAELGIRETINSFKINKHFI